jgi:hypothetical protein
MTRQPRVSNESNISNFVKKVILTDYPDMHFGTAVNFVSKAFDSTVLLTTSENDLNSWYQNNFKPNIFLLDEQEYTEATIQSLRIQFLIAGTDFGTTRQRDLGQKWSDTIRGYLGELGVKQVLKNKFNIDIELGHEEGTLEEYLPTDIHMVKSINDFDYRKPNINVSIKTAKSNGIWLDIPGEQFSKSDVYIFALIGVEVDHLFSFFKHISVFKDKILKKGIDANCINEDEANVIFNKIPSFNKVYGYIPGIVTKDINPNSFSYEGRMGRSTYKIKNWSGKYMSEYLNQIKNEFSASKVEFEGIGSFSQNNRHIFGLKSLEFNHQFWNKHLISKL